MPNWRTSYEVRLCGQHWFQHSSLALSRYMSVRWNRQHCLELTCDSAMNSRMKRIDTESKGDFRTIPCLLQAVSMQSCLCHAYVAVASGGFRQANCLRIVFWIGRPSICHHWLDHGASLWSKSPIWFEEWLPRCWGACRALADRLCTITRSFDAVGCSLFMSIQ